MSVWLLIHFISKPARSKTEHQFSTSPLFSGRFEPGTASISTTTRRKELDTLSLEGSPHATTPEGVEATALQVSANEESPLETVEAIELGGEIERAIGQLRPEYRSCILLRHVEGRAYEEIAEMLDLPLGTVKTYIHRARHELRLALQHLRE